MPGSPLDRLPDGVVVAPEVADALRSGGAVVALESTIISHGLPRPTNVDVARQIEAAVREQGAVPATIAIVDGTVRVGLDEAALATVAGSDDVVKASVRDVAVVVARRGHGATTVASTSTLSALVGIDVFATGGLGGVHRGATSTFDESADLTTLGTTPITVVSAGVKSILDVAATLERLETLNVTVLGYGTDRFPGFYLADSGHDVPHRVDAPEEVAAVMAARRSLGATAALLVANPLPADRQVDPELHDRVLAQGLAAADAAGVRGKDVTPFLLAHFHEASGGESLRANTEIILANAALAGRIAVAGAQS
ncbi:pseudouridine-5'-phosphate glycosidase [Aquihabitans sp. McL0605]|uniref:pseudouridine-5'-phosphate glycosidase n=1 Tax=Aquihabitans sp. McL0605 TaxID=3415671 RepID=UPI003CF82F2C